MTRDISRWFSLPRAPPGEKLELVPIALVDSYADALRRDATRGNMETQGQMSDVSPCEPITPLDPVEAVSSDAPVLRPREHDPTTVSDIRIPNLVP
jgi:hypothetical protein